MQKSRDKEIRRFVLEKLYELGGNAIPISYGHIASACGVSFDELPPLIKYWKQKNCVEIITTKTPSQYSEVMLTADGIDLVEREDFKPSVIQTLNSSNPSVGRSQSSDMNTFWDLLHPKIVQVSKSRFETGHFADAVEAALKEVNNIIKTIVKQKTIEIRKSNVLT